MERTRRCKKNACNDIIFDKTMPLKIAQEIFLSNAKNKSRLIDMLRETLTENKIFSCQAEADADRLIIETAVNLQSENIAVVSEDVDVLVLLTALSPPDREIYFRKPSKGKILQRAYSSKSLEKILPKCKEHILFLHAFTGCDTTSAFFKRGKNVFAKNFEKRTDLQNAATVFKNECKDINEIFKAGVTCTLALYNAPQKIKDLNELRYNSFLKATAKNTCVKLPSLPPTADAAFEHFKRVYLQVQTWFGKEISPEEWGWKDERGILIPQTMTQRPAPESLLKIIFCACKTGCGASCGCRKSGLNCTAACLECNGDSCTNPLPTIYINEIDDDDDNNEQ